jgi:hypothetical protein
VRRSVARALPRAPERARVTGAFVLGLERAGVSVGRLQVRISEEAISRGGDARGRSAFRTRRVRAVCARDG